MEDNSKMLGQFSRWFKKKIRKEKDTESNLCVVDMVSKLIEYYGYAIETYLLAYRNTLKFLRIKSINKITVNNTV